MYAVFWRYLSLVVDIPLLNFLLKCPTLNCCSCLVRYTVACYFSSRLNVLIEHLNVVAIDDDFFAFELFSFGMFNV